MSDNENNHENPYIDENGNFRKGNPGRPKQGGNKATLRIKDAIANFIENNIDAVQENFDKLRPLQKLQFITNLLPYVVPKLSNVEGELNQNHTGGITIRWEEPSVLDTTDQGSNGVVQSLQEGIQDNSEPRGDEVG